MVKIVLEHRTKSPENTQILVELIKQVRAVARKQPGFITGETLVDAEDPCHAVVISTWKRVEDWEAWDKSPERMATRPVIEALLVVPFNAMILSTPVVWREDIAHEF
ncbi:MAG TPA: antibiotic biosynthesis monooxygenase [Dehalococcoidales bacterium]|nr:antibiotic biosynthesis monooxygenase [Dehalococcoidales bacterium]